METVQRKKKSDPIIDFPRLWAVLVRRKTTYFKVIPTVVLVVWIISLGLPDYYKCKIQLAPEDNSGQSVSSLAMLASTFGVNLGSNSGGDAIKPMFFPDLMNSVEFNTSLFNIMVKRPTDKAPMTYYDYLKNEQQDPWWITFKNALFSDKEENKTGLVEVNPFELTAEQTAIAGMIKSKIICDISNSLKTQEVLVSIEVTDQDPHVAAIMVDSVKEHFQAFVTDYKTKKARHDLEFTEKLYKDAKKDYERARRLYAEFLDGNHDLLLESVRQKQTDLENEMQLLYNNYNAISTQLLAAKVRVQEVTPAFTTLEPATVPLWPSGPNRSRLVVLFTIVALFFTTIWVLYDENEIRPLLGLTDKKDE
ncbi:MAG: chain-length determining protein [Prevotella sp.]|nr:chain-length determining protein [Prevotella sp.]